MKTQSADTPPDIEARQIELLRKAGASERVRMMRSLSATVMQMSWNALRELNPDATEQEIRLLFVKLNYGEKLANAVRDYLAKREVRLSKPMVSQDILVAIQPIAEAFETLEIAYYIVGSVASSAIGIPRSTLDADIVAEIEQRHVLSLVEMLGSDYYADTAMILDAIAERSSFNILYLKNGIKIDIFVPKKEPFAEIELTRKQFRSLGEGEQARHYPVASTEDIVLRKLAWFAMGGGVSERQWLDVTGILKLRSAYIDAEYMLKWAPQLGVSELLQNAFMDAGLSPTGEIEF